MVGVQLTGRWFMHVVIQHRINDPEQFFAGDPEQVRMADRLAYAAANSS
jgi:hypothetical protein